MSFYPKESLEMCFCFTIAVATCRRVLETCSHYHRYTMTTKHISPTKVVSFLLEFSKKDRNVHVWLNEMRCTFTVAVVKVLGVLCVWRALITCRRRPRSFSKDTSVYTPVTCDVNKSSCTIETNITSRHDNYVDDNSPFRCIPSILQFSEVEPLCDMISW